MLVPLVLVLAAVAFMLARGVLLASLPDQDGVIEVRGLVAPVRVARDALAVPKIEAASLEDACFAQGFVHAQERYVQMDAMRRYASGRLAEVFGAALLSTDKRMRPNGFERKADEVLKRLPARHAALLRAYAAGVNEGLRRLGATPPEYALLQTPIKSWSERDSLLMQYAMWDMLAMNRNFELMIGTMRAALPEATVRFLTPDVSRFDVVPVGDDAWKYEVPGPEAVTPRQAEATPNAPGIDPDPFPLGSNAFAVAGRRSSTGGALLANDMHLPLRVPALWFRVSLSWNTGRLDGFSLPGVPGVVVGSNAKVAWGFTNLEGDFEDWIVVETDPRRPERYLVPGGGSEEFGRLVEQIDVARAASQRLELRETIWGPVVRNDAQGHPLVSRWIAHDTGHTNIDLFDLFTAETIESAVEAASSWQGPPQNVLIASKEGRIAWTVSGAIPTRAGFDGSFPVSWATEGTGWTGWIDESRRPRVIDPPAGVLYTANNRTLPLHDARLFGRAWASPNRAARIAERLAATEQHNETTLFAIQLDTARPSMDFYRGLALEACTGTGTPHPDATNIRAVLGSWNGTADADQRAFALLKRFRAQLRAKALSVLTDPCKKIDPQFRYSWFNDEEPLRTVLEARPPHLLPPGHTDWPALIRACLDDAIRDLNTAAPARGLDTAWGDLNRAKIEHPLSPALASIPGVRNLLDMPPVPLPGDGLSVRAQSSEFGASQRLVVSPSRESTAIAQLPGGQSGHFLSPHYRDQFEAWTAGTPTPLLPGPTVHSMSLVPAR